MRQSPFLATIVLAGLVMLVCMATQANAQTATLSIRAHTGNDTLYVGMPGAVVVSLSNFDGCLGGVHFYCQWLHDSASTFDNLVPPENPTFSAKVLTAFESVAANAETDADTSIIGLIDFGGDQWTGDGELWRYNLVPAAPNQVHFALYATNGGPPIFYTGLSTCEGGEFVFNADTPGVTIVPCSAGNLDGGDANFDRVVTSSDIIYLVSHVFKSGVEPVISNMGDTDCSNTITAADIIFLVGYVFKSMAPPCDPCETVP